MRILLVDADSKKGFANLALMKISAWEKAKGHRVELIRGIPEAQPLVSFDRIYISCIYFQNKKRVLDYAEQLTPRPIIGGSGFSNQWLTDEIEHIFPDYDLYKTNYSMGFTSRGCLRKCPWCIVPDKEGKLRDYAPVSEFHDPRFSRMILLDNNFQASPKWRENMDYIIDNKLKVNFNQGLDARLVTPLFAEMLAASKCYNWTFKVRGAHLAFDTMQAEKPLIRALEIFDEYGMPAKRFVVYILVGFNTLYEEDVYRVKRTIELGAVPYVMRYNQTEDSGLGHLARWVNRKMYEWVSFQDYKGGVLVA